MPVEQIERQFPVREGRNLFGELQQVLAPYVEKFSLTQENDEAGKNIRVHRLGFEGKLQVEGSSLVRLTLDYSRLIPGALRNRITEGVVAALDRMHMDWNSPGNTGGPAGH